MKFFYLSRLRKMHVGSEPWMRKRQTGKSESWAPGEINTCPDSPGCCCSFPGRRHRLPGSRGSNLATAGAEGWLRPSVAEIRGGDLCRAAERLPSSHMRSADGAVDSGRFRMCFSKLRTAHSHSTEPSWAQAPGPAPGWGSLSPPLRPSAPRGSGRPPETSAPRWSPEPHRLHFAEEGPKRSPPAPLGMRVRERSQGPLC